MHGLGPPSVSYSQEHPGRDNPQSSFIGDLIPLAFLNADHSAHLFQSSSVTDFALQAPDGTHEGNDSEQGGAPIVSRNDFVTSAAWFFLCLVHPGRTPTEREVEQVIRYALGIPRSEP